MRYCKRLSFCYASIISYLFMGVKLLCKLSPHCTKFIIHLCAYTLSYFQRFIKFRLQVFMQLRIFFCFCGLAFQIITICTLIPALFSAKALKSAVISFQFREYSKDIPLLYIGVILFLVNDFHVATPLPISAHILAYPHAILP